MLSYHLCNSWETGSTHTIARFQLVSHILRCFSRGRQRPYEVAERNTRLELATSTKKVALYQLS